MRFDLDTEKIKEVIKCYSTVSELADGIKPLDNKLDNLGASYARHKKTIQRCVDELFELCIKLNNRKIEDCIIEDGKYTYISVVPHDIMKRIDARPGIFNNYFIISEHLKGDIVYLLVCETCIAMELILKLSIHHLIKQQCEDLKIAYNYDEVAAVLKSARGDKAKKIKENYKDTSLYHINNSSHSLTNLANVLLESDYESNYVSKRKLGEIIHTLNSVDSDKLMEQVRYGEEIESSTWKHIENMLLFIEHTVE